MAFVLSWLPLDFVSFILYFFIKNFSYVSVFGSNLSTMTNKARALLMSKKTLELRWYSSSHFSWHMELGWKTNSSPYQVPVTSKSNGIIYYFLPSATRQINVIVKALPCILVMCSFLDVNSMQTIRTANKLCYFLSTLPYWNFILWETLTLILTYAFYWIQVQINPRTSNEWLCLILLYWNFTFIVALKKISIISKCYKKKVVPAIAMK